MGLQIVTHWSTLMAYAKALGDARRRGNAQDIAEAQRQHDDYIDLCLKADRMDIGMTVGEMFNGRRPYNG